MVPIFGRVSPYVILVFLLCALLIVQQACTSPIEAIGQSQSANQASNSTKQYITAAESQDESLEQDEDLSDIKSAGPEKSTIKTPAPPYSISNQSWYMDAPRILKMGLFLG